MQLPRQSASMIDSTCPLNDLQSLETPARSSLGMVMFTDFLAFHVIVC